MSVNEIPQIYIPRASRARQQRLLGLVLMTLLCAFISCAIVWGYGEAQYRSCLSKTDSAYASGHGFDHITWATTKSSAATRCAETNVVPNKYLN